jgi:hypothetical protein
MFRKDIQRSEEVSSITIKSGTIRNVSKAKEQTILDLGSETA